MSHIADRFVVLLDANVLFPFRKRDVLFSFYHAGLFRGRWTAEILAEWSRNLLALRPELSASIHTQHQIMEREFPEALVTGHEDLIPSLTLPDPDDRHVLAAAIRCGAQQIVTDNLKDFPAARLGPYDIEAITADSFLSQTFDLYPYEALPVVRDIRIRYRNPAFTAPEFLMDLTAKGLPLLAARLRDKQHLI